MTAEAAQSILRRKAGAHDAVGPTAMDTPKAFRMALARAGDTVLETAIGLRSFVEDGLIPDDLDADTADTALILRFETEAGSRAIAIVTLQAVAAVVEAMTLGTVIPGEAAERAPTRGRP